MKCFDPVLCYTQNDGRKQYRHFSLANPVFKRVAQQVFRCNKCLVCRKRNSYELAARCVLHASLYKQSCFLTLTYDEKQDTYHNNFNYPDIQGFTKSLRNYANTVEYSHLRSKKLKRRRVPKWLYRRIKLFNVHEYGKNGKKHWHLIVLGFQFSDRRLVPGGESYYGSDALSLLWPYGFSVVGDVSEASAMYTAQYAQKDIKNRTTASLKASKSKHSGLGKEYFLKHYKQILELGYVPFDSAKMPVPRYFIKIAERHYSHFYDQTAFQTLPGRKAPKHRRLRESEAILGIAEAYRDFKLLREEKILALEEEWEEMIFEHLQKNEIPNFVKSASNSLYDFYKKKQLQGF